MSVEAAVERAVREHPDLVIGAQQQIPTTWGRLAAHGVLVFRAETGRAPSDAERRAIWAGLWAAVQGGVEHATAYCDACGTPLDPASHAICAVCEGLRLCVDCARSHLCTSECRERGCVRALCVKLVRNGVVADGFGIP